MVWSLEASALVELLVVLFQVLGVLALCVSRLHAGPRWADRGRLGLVIALVGLGVAGVLNGPHHSEFSLFAGLTMGAFLVCVCLGGHPSPSATRILRAEPELHPVP